MNNKVIGFVYKKIIGRNGMALLVDANPYRPLIKRRFSNIEYLGSVKSSSIEGLKLKLEYLAKKYEDCNNLYDCMLIETTDFALKYPYKKC